jgi:hypothetical protein
LPIWCQSGRYNIKSRDWGGNNMVTMMELDDQSAMAMEVSKEFNWQDVPL